MKNIKLNLTILILLFIVIIVTCNVNRYNEKKQKEKWDIQQSENEKLFYYSEYHDKYWTSYSPNLIGAEGNIMNDSKCGKSGLPVKIIKLDIKDRGVGSYEGSLTVRVLGWNENILKHTGIDSITTIDYKCFKPNYKKGEWLNGKKLD